MRLNTGRESRVSTVVARITKNLHRYGGHIGAYLIVGGVDATGNYICSISAHGYHSYNNFTSLGSGSLAALGILETRYKDDITVEQGKALAIEAISAGIIEDLGSGS